MKKCMLYAERNFPEIMGEIELKDHNALFLSFSEMNILGVSFPQDFTLQQWRILFHSFSRNPSSKLLHRCKPNTKRYFLSSIKISFKVYSAWMTLFHLLWIFQYCLNPFFNFVFFKSGMHTHSDRNHSTPAPGIVICPIHPLLQKVFDLL